LAELILESLRKEFGSFVAVDDLSLKVESGKFASLLGPSGCGKTTTLRMIAGLTEPTSGSIYIEGKIVNDLPSRQRKVGLVFQSYAIFPDMNVFDNIAFGLKISKIDEGEIRRQAMEMAKLLQLEDVLDQNPKKLRLDEAQRLAIGRTLLTKPKVLLLDEPLSNLDASLRARMRSELKRLQAQLNQTVVMVTHDQLEAMTLADEIAVMDGGRLQQYGTPEEIYNHPANTFVANFVGTPTMNSLRCTVERSGSRLFLKTRSFSVDVSELVEYLASFETGSDVTLGFRPGDAAPAGPTNRNGSFEATIEIIEPLGHRKILHCGLGDDTIKVSVSGDADFRPGERRSFQLDTSKIHVFDTNGKAVV